MKSFSYTDEQMCRIVYALITEEVNWRYGRHLDFHSIAEHGYDTSLADGGLLLSDEQIKTSLQRSYWFFGHDIDNVDHTIRAKYTVRNIASFLASKIRSKLTTFNFLPAGSESLQDGCVHFASDIYIDACALTQLIYGRQRIVSYVSPHSLMGFIITILVANLEGIESVDFRAMTPETISNSLLYGDAIVATPTQWRYLVSEGVTAPDNAMAVTFGEVLPTDLAMEMRKAGFGAHRELYGTTENGLIGWRDSSREPFVLFDFWRRDKEDLLRRKSNGEWLPNKPMDILEFDSTEKFSLAGRRDGAVQVGAINVFPKKVAEIVKQHHSVADCNIEIIGSGTEGRKVVAQINLSSNNQPSEKIARDIDGWCRIHLRPFERPRIYNFV